MWENGFARFIDRGISRMAAIGDTPDDSEEQKLAHHHLIYMGVLMSCGAVVWGAIALYYELYLSCSVPFGYVVLTALNFAYFGVSNDFRRVRRFQVLISLLLPFVFQWALGGFVASGGVMLWAVVALLSSLVFQDVALSLICLGAFLALTILSGLIDSAVSGLAAPAPGRPTTAFFVVNIVVTSALAFWLNVYQLAKREEAKAKLAEMASVLKKMFGRYLSAEVMNSLVENPSALELGGTRTTVTIMMSDLRGFTAIAERLQPEQVVQMLNTYFEAMVDLVLKYNGTINEIIGDALLVIFGAPKQLPDRAQCAVACAIEMQNAMAAVNAHNRAQGLPELEMGIGLNETEVIVGNIGSSKRSKYAAVGSGVNMTSRIESYAVGGQILISESVRRAAGGALRIDAQREVLPKGAEAPIRIYEVGGIAGAYNLALSGKNAALVRLARGIRLRCAVLEGKDVGRAGVTGLAVQLSRSGAHVRFSAALDVLTNVKLNLEDVDEALSAKDFYAKVMQRLGDHGELYLVSLTAVPAEVDAYFQAHLAFGSGAAAA